MTNLEELEKNNWMVNMREIRESMMQKPEIEKLEENNWIMNSFLKVDDDTVVINGETYRKTKLYKTDKMIKIGSTGSVGLYEYQQRCFYRMEINSKVFWFYLPSSYASDSVTYAGRVDDVEKEKLEKAFKKSFCE